MTFFIPKAHVLITHLEWSKWSTSGLFTHLLRAKRAISTCAFGVKKGHALFRRGLRSSHPFVNHPFGFCRSTFPPPPQNRTIRFAPPLLISDQGPLNGGVSNGGVSRSGLVLPFLSFFFFLFGTFPIFSGFSRFVRRWIGDFPDLSFSSFSAYYYGDG